MNDYLHISDAFAGWLERNDIDYEGIVHDHGQECYRFQEDAWHYFAYEIEQPTFCLVVKHEEREYAPGNRSGSVDYIMRGSERDARRWLKQLLEQAA